MPKGPPKTIALNHDDYHAESVGHTADGRQFFLTTPFVPAQEVGTPTGREFIALFIFDAAGQLQSVSIDDLGPRVTMDHAARERRRDELLASLGKVKYKRIKMAPFRVQAFGVEYGLIPRAPEEPDEDWCVTLEPGDYMCFWPPWSSGEYDT
jgi:hypothetical protein